MTRAWRECSWCDGPSFIRGRWCANCKARVAAAALLYSALGLLGWWIADAVKEAVR